MACLALARLVARGSTASLDARLRRAVRVLDRLPVRVVARAAGPLGKWYGYLPFAVVTSAKLATAHRRSTPALAVVGSAVVARLASEAIELGSPHHEPPPGRGDPSVQSFPSGHTLEPLAVGLVSAVVLAREGVRSPALTALGLVSPALAGLGRLVLDRHWASDVAGGALAGLAVAGACLGAHALAG